MKPSKNILPFLLTAAFFVGGCASYDHTQKDISTTKEQEDDTYGNDIYYSSKEFMYNPAVLAENDNKKDDLKPDKVKKDERVEYYDPEVAESQGNNGYYYSDSGRMNCDKRRSANENYNCEGYESFYRSDNWFRWNNYTANDGYFTNNSSTMCRDRNNSRSSSGNAQQEDFGFDYDDYLKYKGRYGKMENNISNEGNGYNEGTENSGNRSSFGSNYLKSTNKKNASSSRSYKKPAKRINKSFDVSSGGNSSQGRSSYGNKRWGNSNSYKSSSRSIKMNKSRSGGGNTGNYSGSGGSGGFSGGEGVKSKSLQGGSLRKSRGGG
ncbi:MAG: hypothetical protein ABEH43_07265 [Flavobacteriales bacterium]